MTSTGRPAATHATATSSTTDARAEIKSFLTTRRARVTPEMVALPVGGGHRRVPGLRREEVAMLAGVSVDYYTRLERGNMSGASQEVLEAIAGALLLDDAERHHLFDLAQAVSPHRADQVAQPAASPSLGASRGAVDPGLHAQPGGRARRRGHLRGG
ncbi:helix-turn-helix transcriptional regulator [Actinomyces urogenitalis]|uniref:helix-turn-helix domain-containing protein n=1 Tax=Actinomyces urogenitalis TaxID=103621 RepID=UPI0028054569|nr:helix-turn-helix transcriptional regulator [Actinomyces urogenitalis]MDU0863611.1 helix-turn-helix transcriptional regulator [Actinomyces urogenitalis]MDU0874044.1 helix-turn-helix transcriptional regulator [Actinomyces urogenitalis]MDU1563746.1 helix-turn-helix transcriptional regulator [Actinomyces urogenitalis]MDU1639113.1 helix-turn-helix transcriptional regulator [Actinomyces urogenitalis]MDU6776864.1 helix-turn-helix transcriptional regulator [Actinomyces urogenitalis]